MIRPLLSLAISLSALPGSTQPLVQQPALVHEAVPGYAPQAQITGEIATVGSDPLTWLFDSWSSSFRKHHPAAVVKFTPSTTPRAAKSFIAGEASLAFLARELTPEESKAFEARFGYPALRIPLCIDATIVFVNRSNPLKHISMQELDAAFGTQRLGGARKDIATWGDLGLRREWKKRPIVAYSREKTTAICQLFKEQVLLKGEAKSTIIERPDAASVAEAALTDPLALAYAPIVAWFAGNNVIPVIPYQGQEPVPPTQEAITSGRYPMTRLNYMYLNRAPGKPLPDSVREFAAFALSRQGQMDIAESGLFPASPEMIQMGLKRLQ